MSDTVVHRDKFSQVSIGLTNGGLCVALRTVDGSQRAEVFLEPQAAESVSRLLASFAAEARANGLAAVEGRLR